MYNGDKFSRGIAPGILSLGTTVVSDQLHAVENNLIPLSEIENRFLACSARSPMIAALI
jgi:hypothetical protein